jgi:hypothetical protein
MIEEDDSHDSEFSTEGKGDNNIEDSSKEETKNTKNMACLIGSKYRSERMVGQLQVLIMKALQFHHLYLAPIIVSFL